MPLPPVAFYSIYEIAVRWGCHPADVAGWAAAGHLQVLAGIPPVSCGDETVAGLVEVPIAELMPMFRRIGPSDEQARLRRVICMWRSSAPTVRPLSVRRSIGHSPRLCRSGASWRIAMLPPVQDEYTPRNQARAIALEAHRKIMPHPLCAGFDAAQLQMRVIVQFDLATPHQAHRFRHLLQLHEIEA